MQSDVAMGEASIVRVGEPLQRIDGPPRNLHRCARLAFAKLLGERHGTLGPIAHDIGAPAVGAALDRRQQPRMLQTRSTPKVVHRARQLMAIVDGVTRNQQPDILLDAGVAGQPRHRPGTATHQLSQLEASERARQCRRRAWRGGVWRAGGR